MTHFQNSTEYHNNEDLYAMEKERMRLQLKALIDDWNANRLDLFALNEPNEDLEFHGVMRFYFQELGSKVATKCIRVSSTATTRSVIEALVEKFHPDMKMLASEPSYSLWEVHENGFERCLSLDEKPLLVQLNWHKDDREGRFMLKNENDERVLKLIENKENDPQMKRKLSRREKKEQKRQEKLNRSSSSGKIRPKSLSKEYEDLTRDDPTETDNQFSSIQAKILYKQVPASNFTRTISNPEIVMKKRRERKLEQKLREMGEGGSLKIYGHDLSSSKPYVTLLLSTRDRVDKIVRETLEKYGLDWHDPQHYCLVEVRSGTQDRIMQEHELPLLHLGSDVSAGLVSFHVRRRNMDEGGRCSRQSYDSNNNGSVHTPNQHSRAPPPAYSNNPQQLQQRPNRRSSYQSNIVDAESTQDVPCFVELSNSGERKNVFNMHQSVVEVGNDPQLTISGLFINGPKVQVKHCILAYMDGVVTLTPCSPAGQTWINEKSVDKTTILRPNDKIRFGQSSSVFLFTFVQPHAAEPWKPNGRMESPVTTLERRSSLAKPYQTQNGTNNQDALPAVIEVTDEAESDFLSLLIRRIRFQDCGSFKLGPAYMSYMVARCKLMRLNNNNVNQEREKIGNLRLSDFFTKIADILHVTIQDFCHDAANLTFWMANCSEMLNFIKSDLQLNQITHPEPQESLADAVQKSFDHLVVCFKQDLHQIMPGCLKFSAQDTNDQDLASVSEILHCFDSCMQILRTCRVNAALTIQIFAQLFHYVNMYLFNWLISREGSPYCCRRWGVRLANRLTLLRNWAEQQGLELAAECRMQRLSQAAILLSWPKFTSEDMNILAPLCAKLNQIQVRSILERYRSDLATNEPVVAKDFIDRFNRMVQNFADESTRLENQLEEDVDLQLPFLLPDDGYSPETVRGLAPGLREFAEFFLRQNICRMIMQPTASGLWSVHFGARNENKLNCGSQSMVQSMPDQNENNIIDHQKIDTMPVIVEIAFEKGSGGIGLSIVQAQGQGQREPGIYVKKVVPNSAAARDRRLESGDQLLKVNGQSLVGVSQDYAAQCMSKSGNFVCFEVAKRAAFYNGLSTWMQSDDTSPLEPPPVITVQQPKNPIDLTPKSIIYDNGNYHKRSISSTVDTKPHNYAEYGHHEQQANTSESFYENGPPYGVQEKSTPRPSHISPHRWPTASLDRSMNSKLSPSREERLERPRVPPPERPLLNPDSSPSSVFPPPYYNNNTNAVAAGATKSPPPVVHYQKRSASSSVTSQERFYQKQESSLSPNGSYAAVHKKREAQENGFKQQSGDTERNSMPIYCQQQQEKSLDNRMWHTEDGLSENGEFKVDRNVSYQLDPKPDRIIQPSQKPRFVPPEDFEQRMKTEVERLLMEEFERLRSKPHLNQDEQMRLEALRYDLTVRQCLPMEEDKSPEDLIDFSNHRKSPDTPKLQNGNKTKGPVVFLEPEKEPFARIGSENLNIDKYRVSKSPSPVKSVEKENPVVDIDLDKKYYIFDNENNYEGLEEEERMQKPPRAQVIGAQEIYRDPRQERLKNLQKPATGVEGEKLSFKDKMRLFAKEMGETTPKDRVKVSSAQREIETNMAPR